MTWETKDLIEDGLKIAGFLVATFGAYHSIAKSREERRTSAEKDRAQKERQLLESRAQAEKYQEQKRLQLAQMEQARRVNEARFWLELRRMFQEHSEIALKLRGGRWAGPSSAEEWSRVESYMGLFEHCSRMLHDGLISAETFKNLYGYRIDNILATRSIVEEKLIKRAEGWKDFLELVRIIGREVPKFDTDAQRPSRPAESLSVA